MLNKMMAIGNLGKDVEVKYTQGGDVLASFSVAVSERWKDKSGEMVEKTEWISCVAWRKLAETCGEYLHKGSKVYIEGKLQTRKWQDKDGNDKYTTEVVLSKMEMLDGKKSGDEQRDNRPQQPASGDDNAVPF
ncbi:MAG: single-stranded DNA-binding protein [Chlorobium sp.]|nr:single-stranded DNA-binding protein [Chlorobium sp.]